MRYLNFTPIVNAPNSSSISSAALDCNQLLKLSLQANITGTPTGSIQLQFSNDQVTNVFGDFVFINWSDLGLPLDITSAGTYGIVQQDICYRAIRVVYTSTDVLATGVINANLMVLSM